MRRLRGLRIAVLLLPVALAPVGEALPQDASAAVSVADRGCHADQVGSGRDLDGAFLEDPAMTVTTCLGFCFEEGFRVAGLQAGTQCHCGSAYGRYGADATCNTPCGGDASQDCGGPAANHVYEFLSGGAPAQPKYESGLTTVPETVERVADVFAVGRWPEGLAFDGESLWVAESGARQVARLDPESGEVRQRIRVGRLPVGLAAAPDGEVFAAVATDRKIWRSDSDEPYGLQDYPQAITAGAEAVHVLVWIDGGSSRTAVVRFDRDTGAMLRSAVLPKNGFDLATGAGTVLTLHRLDGESRSEFVILDAETLERKGEGSFSGYATTLAVAADGVFAAGGDLGKAGLVVKLDPVSGEELARSQVPGFVAALAAGSGLVVAVEQAGAIHVLSAADLVPVRTIVADYDEPRDVLLAGPAMYITTHRGIGGNGSVLRIRDWMPEGKLP